MKALNFISSFLPDTLGYQTQSLMNRALLLLAAICFPLFSFQNIPISNGDGLAYGLFLGVKNKQPYGLFAKEIKSEKDRPFFTVTGEVMDDDDVYSVCEATKAQDPFAKGNLLTISNIDQTITAAGSFDICPEIKNIDIKVAGTAAGKTGAPATEGSEINPSELAIDWIAGFDFNLPKDLMKIMMADFIEKQVDTLALQSYQSEAYTAAANEWNSESKSKKRADFINQLKEGNPFQLNHDDTPGTFTLGGLSMKWESQLQSFISKGQQATLINMGKEDLHYPIQADVEFYMPSSKNDQVRILLHSSNDHFYFFNYMNGLLQTCSNNELYNQFLFDLKEKDSEITVFKGQPYELHFATAYVVGLFKERIKVK